MNIGVMILVVIGGLTGFLSSLYMVGFLVGVIGYKIYRSIRYHVSLYD